jgi:hypothetical protein
MRLLHRDHQDAGDHTDEIRVTSDGVAETDRSNTMVRDPAPIAPPAPERPAAERAAAHGVPERRTAKTVRERTWTFAPGQLISFVAGVGLIAVGLVALVRAGIDGALATPTVHVLTYTHTAWLGLAELGLGLLLVLAGTGAWGRPISVLLGAAAVVAGVLIVAEPDQMPDRLGLEKNYGWPLMAMGAVVALAAMALPVWRRRKILDEDVLEREVDLRDDIYVERRVPF